MQTNVNFLMWAAVTVLLVLTSLLLGLFWGKRTAVMTGAGLSWADPLDLKEHLVLFDVPEVWVSSDSLEDSCHVGSLSDSCQAPVNEP
jgi:hypothetical protein